MLAQGPGPEPEPAWRALLAALPQVRLPPVQPPLLRLPVRCPLPKRLSPPPALLVLLGLLVRVRCAVSRP